MGFSFSLRLKMEKFLARCMKARTDGIRIDTENFCNLHIGASLYIGENKNGSFGFRERTQQESRSLKEASRDSNFGTGWGRSGVQRFSLSPTSCNQRLFPAFRRCCIATRIATPYIQVVMELRP